MQNVIILGATSGIAQPLEVYRQLIETAQAEDGGLTEI